MTTKEKQAVRTVLEDLVDRQPESAREGFMPEPEVVAAMKLLIKVVGPIGERE